MESPAPDLRYDDPRPVIAALREQLKAKAGQCDWLWNSCVDLYRDLYGWDYYPETYQVAFLEAAISLLPNYSPRSFPSDATLETASFRSLVGILDEAPEIEWGPADESKPNLAYWCNGFSGEEYYEWTDEYFSRVFQGLVDVVNEHGLGGWECARWMVYDKVRPLFSVRPFSANSCSCPVLQVDEMQGQHL